MASIDETGGGGGSKRHRDASAAGFTDADDSGGRSKRCAAAAAAPFPGSAAGSDDSGGADPESADGDGVSEYADEESDDGVYEHADSEDDAAAERSAQDADADAASASAEEERRYVVLTEDALRARQEADTARVAEVLSVPAGHAALLLRHFRWRVGRAQEEWFADGPRVRAAVGLPLEEDGGRAEVSAPSSCARVCGICFDEHPAGATMAAACGAHFFCGDCWRGYLSAAARDGARCLSLRCPEPSCPAAVARELVDAVLLSDLGADADARERYSRFWLRSYVEEGGGRVRWCAAPGCPLALEWVGGDATASAAESTDVFCACRQGFCWACGEEAHRPVSCATVRAWLAKGRSEAETANWVVAHTKPCPKCRRPIEKNQGCNHMRCSAPCGHHFCWLCLQPAGGANHYSCQDPQRAAAVARAARARPGAPGPAHRTPAPTAEEARKRQARAALERYLHHYERWAANKASLDAALRDTAALLERGGLDRMARAADRPACDLGFVTEAYAQVADGRRVLRWAHAYGYYLDPARDAAKRALFDDLEAQANRWLECLHAAAEVERKDLFGSGPWGGGGVVAAEAFMAYREKVANLTRVTRRFIGNLVRAFETDLPEVVAAAAEAPTPAAEPHQRAARSLRLFLGGGPARNIGPGAARLARHRQD